MDLICYLHPGWAPLIRPAEATRPWMDATPESFAYRCLPLNIANAHGWEVLCPCDAEAYWTGRPGTGDVIVRSASGTAAHDAPVSLFGQGTITFHIQALFRTPPGWDLWISGSPNHPKEGLMPLSGVVETDWSPYTFTMNWRFTRRGHWVRFKRGEPICFIFPVQRGALERMEPKFVALGDNPELAADFHAWSQSRNQFQADVATDPHRPPADKWQKRYYRGVSMRNERPAPGHRARLRLKPFVNGVPDEAQTEVAFTYKQIAALLDAARSGAADVAAALHKAGVPEPAARRIAEAHNAGKPA